MPCLVIPRVMSLDGVWDVSPLPSICPAHLKGVPKAVRRAWQESPPGSQTPDDCLAVPVEGMSPTLRVRRGSSPADCNPPVRIHSIFVDIDSYGWRQEQFPDLNPDCRPDELAQAISDAYAARYRELSAKGRFGAGITPFAPDWVYRTPGDGVRLVWEFDVPVEVPQGFSPDREANLKVPFDFVSRFWQEFTGIQGLAFGRQFRARGVHKPWLRQALSSGLADDLAPDECGMRATQPYALVTSERWAPVPKPPGTPAIPDIQMIADAAAASVFRTMYRVADSLGDDRTYQDVGAMLENKFGHLLPGIGTMGIGCKMGHFMDSQFNPLPAVSTRNPRACEIRDRGIAVHSTSGTLVNGFYTWVQILHEELEVRQSQSFTEIASRYCVNFASATGSVPIRVRPGYFWKLDGEWLREISEDTLRHELATEWKLSPKRKDGGASQVDCAIHCIEKTRQVISEVRLPFVEWDQGAIRPFAREGDPNAYLEHNLLYRKFRIVDPHPAPVNPDADFPTIANWLRGFTDGHALNYLLAWLREPYILASRKETARGQVALILGPKNSGKSFLFEEILYPMFHGGRHPADSPSGGPSADFLITGSPWTGAIGNHFALVIDDIGEAVRESDQADARLRFSTAIKTISASGLVQSNTKYGAQQTISFQGRILFLGNEEDSAAMIPASSESLLDKFMLFRAHGIPPERQLSPAEARDRFRAELPYFLSWLRAWTPPAECIPQTSGTVDKFGVRAYQDPELLAHSRSGGRNASLMGWLEDFRVNLLTVNKGNGVPLLSMRLDSLHTQLHGYLTTIGALVNPRDFPSAHGFSIALGVIMRQQGAELPWLTVSTDDAGRRTATLSLDPLIPSRAAPSAAVTANGTPVALLPCPL